ncbi:MAG: ATP-binding cassette domain-containing protein [Gammaproteobacteria bacterium]|nr:ATP-binding cassette domain-containing protein [Gammaproteobacteria bacterium]
MIELKDLQKVIDQKTVLDIATLHVGAGQIAALVGPIDSGKNILFELLIGKSRPTMGTVRVAGIDPFKEKKQFSRLVGVLFADDNLYKRQTARGNLDFFSRLRRLSKGHSEEILARVGLADQAGTRVEVLSSSLARRLAFGRAIFHEPGVLLLVEPFSRCDDPSIHLLSKLVRKMAEEGVSVLIINDDTTHLITSLCDTIYRLDQGRIVEIYKPEEEEPPALPFMIPAKLEGKVALVNPVDIMFVYAQDDRAYLQTTEERFPTQFTVSELEKRLSRSGFFRAHRGYLVNLQHVKEVIPYTRDSYSLRLKDNAGTEIPLSKSAARELRELLGY